MRSTWNQPQANGSHCIVNINLHSVYNIGISEHEPRVQDLIAIKIGNEPKDYEKLIEVLNNRNAAWSVHWETDAFLLDPGTANIVKQIISSTKDVSNTYRDLERRTSGFQVLRIGCEMELGSGKKIRGAERIIRQYPGDDCKYILITGSGGVIPLDLTMAFDRLSSGAFAMPPEPPEGPTIFNSFEEARKAYI